ncbi:hypothetical protein CAOG_07059 [Capsaspora owczarzaki ATCC 30864]|uniref:Z-binding domain-containing protein n=1 Tax=Capsaspora owczarzaki (strain ATCC 30864) TaxID=595528 RepID=A0A0D2WVC4_CAPO3|nr:hypothetical protein CAOG_07059 [Capsaspora owczarzaki ATCC 30864]KJE96790.1 hypothetical protein CAOG_007059 [Capsaspora owczarzaki ATCC 30864]|eukprot:XP_004343783.1 hypothetical protein CAOG_07059 [Capsaspora owczarzaki ATCC 30864]
MKTPPPLEQTALDFVLKNSGVDALAVAKQAKLVTQKDINPTLYALEKAGQIVRRETGSRPLWYGPEVYPPASPRVPVSAVASAAAAVSSPMPSPPPTPPSHRSPRRPQAALTSATSTLTPIQPARVDDLAPGVATTAVPAAHAALVDRDINKLRDMMTSDVRGAQAEKHWQSKYPQNLNNVELRTLADLKLLAKDLKPRVTGVGCKNDCLIKLIQQLFEREVQNGNVWFEPTKTTTLVNLGSKQFPGDYESSVALLIAKTLKEEAKANFWTSPSTTVEIDMITEWTKSNDVAFSCTIHEIKASCAPAKVLKALQQGARAALLVWTVAQAVYRVKTGAIHIKVNCCSCADVGPATDSPERERAIGQLPSKLYRRQTEGTAVGYKIDTRFTYSDEDTRKFLSSLPVVVPTELTLSFSIETDPIPMVR